MDISSVLASLVQTRTRTAGLVLGIWAGGWGVFYVSQEIMRYRELGRRKQRYRQRRRPAVLNAELAAQWYGQAGPEERAAVKGKFSSLRFGWRYLNVTPEWREQGLWEWMWWKLVHSVFWKPRLFWDGGVSRDVRTREGSERLERLLPVHTVDMERLWGKGPEPAPPADTVTHTWFGQSTCLIQMHGVSVLMDPVFGDKPLDTFASPRRIRPLPCTLSQLLASGRIDVVLVSHNHFDHLDLNIVRQMPRSTQWIVPIGVKPLLTHRGVPGRCVHELDWWQDVHLPLRITVGAPDGEVHTAARTFEVTAVPASHWSGRTGLDTNRSLWCSYAVRCLGAENRDPAKLFFCGDSGYSASLFSAIGRLYGPFDLATVPIGSYEPRWHLSLQHMDPEGSVNVARDVGARQSFAMHWGTWCMSDEHWDEPVRDLAHALAIDQLPSSFLSIVPLGTTQLVA